VRRKVKNRIQPPPDSVYNSDEVAKFINSVMKDGKKTTAAKIFYGAMEDIKRDAKVEDPMEVLRLAISNVAPQMEVRSKRIGGANYQVPKEVRPERRQTLAVRWILEAARSGKGKPMRQKLAGEIMLASKNEGEAVKKRENTHRMAESNKAFAHLSW
jgi:small subunit ribosomal protein S7